MHNPDDYEYIIGHPKASSAVYVIREWIPKDIARAHFVWYRDNMPWTNAKIRAWGKEYLSPRLSCFVGDDNIDIHSYSGSNNPVGPWDHISEDIRNQIVAVTGIHLDAGILNYYRDGDDYIAYHSDKESLDDSKTVIGVSFGGSRRFYFKPIAGGDTIKTEVHSGDCMVMYGNIQSNYKHSVPKQKSAEPRISLTLRRIQL